VVNTNHPLANNTHIKLSELKEESFIIFSRDEALGLFDDTISFCKQAGFSPNIISQPKHMQTLVTEVAAGLGVAIAPHCVRKLYSEGCHFIILEDINSSIPVEIQFQKGKNKAVVDTFVEIALNAKDKIEEGMSIKN